MDVRELWFTDQFGSVWHYLMGRFWYVDYYRPGTGVERIFATWAQ